MPAESVVPGYRLVESFGPNSEYETRPSANLEGNEEEGEEVEEEVEYVTLEISGIADVGPELLTSYRLIVSDDPVLCSSTLTVAFRNRDMPVSVGLGRSNALSSTVKFRNDLQRPAP